jgi:hypothetical protein
MPAPFCGPVLLAASLLLLLRSLRSLLAVLALVAANAACISHAPL